MTIDEKLVAAGIKYRKDLLIAPMTAFSDITQHFNVVLGCQGKMISGTLNNGAQLRPYRLAKDSTDTTKITPREMENFKGDLVEEFDPSSVLATLYRENTSTKPDKYDIAGKVAMYIARQVGEKLVDCLFTAVRNAVGNTSAELFNGFDKLVDIALAEVTPALSVALGNYQDYSATTITRLNVGSELLKLYRATNKKLKKGCKMYIPMTLLEWYQDWYKIENGNAPFGADVEQLYLDGTAKKCEIVAMSEMEDGKYIYFSKKDNMCLLFDQMSDTETVELRRPDNPKVVQLSMVAWFGVGMDTLDKEFFKAVKYAQAA
jgi:hypothetical protein